jgi:predicted PurR-regulated permease PerM
MSETDPKMSSLRPRPTPTGGWFSLIERGSIQTLFLGIIAGVMVVAALVAATLLAVPTVLALLCAIALAPAVRWLERTGAPASLCAGIVVGGLLVGTAIAVYAFAPSAEALNTRGPEILRAAESRARQIIYDLSPSSNGGPGSEAPVEPEKSLVTNPDNPPALDTNDEKDPGDDAMDKLVDGGQRLLADWAIGAPRVAAGAVLWAMLTFFLLRDRVMLARRSLSLISRASTRRAVARAMRDVRTNSGSALRSRSTSSAWGMRLSGASRRHSQTSCPLSGSPFWRWSRSRSASFHSTNRSLPLPPLLWLWC